MTEKKEMNLNITVAGNQWITHYLVDALVENHYTPRLLINIPPDRSGKISGYCDLGDIAEAHGIDIYRPHKYSLKSIRDRDALLEKKIDLLLVFGWQRLIPEWLIEHCGRQVFGVHGGPRKPPGCRGRAVFNWALLLGCKTFYMYLFRITPEVDAGEIIDITEFDITPHDDVRSIYHKNCVVSTRMFLQNLPAMLAGNAQGALQADGVCSLLPGRKPENGGIFWDWNAQRIENLIKAVAPPYPGAFTFLDEMKIEIYRGHLFDTRILFTAEPGTILDVFPNGDFIVMAADHPLYVREYKCDQPQQVKKGRRFAMRSGAHLPDPEL
jgi:methionyl-tRNA formyltransferase